MKVSRRYSNTEKSDFQSNMEQARCTFGWCIGLLLSMDSRTAAQGYFSDRRDADGNLKHYPSLGMYRSAPFGILIYGLSERISGCFCINNLPFSQYPFQPMGMFAWITSALKSIPAFRAWAHRSLVFNLYSLPSLMKCVPHWRNSKDTFCRMHCSRKESTQS